jgi:hypothetical protein
MTAPRRRWVLPALLVAAACAQPSHTSRLGSARVVGEEDMVFAERAVAQYRLRVRPSTDAPATGRVEAVARAILNVVKAGPAREHAEKLAWELVVVDGPGTTVATFPNGAVFVEAGLVRALPTDDALACAVGAAVARVLLWNGSDSAARRAARAALASFGGLRPSTRSLAESEKERTEEADYVGAALAVQAGYDLERAIAMFDRLGLGERGDRVREHLPELRELRSASR